MSGSSSVGALRKEADAHRSWLLWCVCEGPGMSGKPVICSFTGEISARTGKDWKTAANISRERSGGCYDQTAVPGEPAIDIRCQRRKSVAPYSH